MLKFILRKILNTLQFRIFIYSFFFSKYHIHITNITIFLETAKKVIPWNYSFIYDIEYFSDFNKRQKAKKNDSSAAQKKFPQENKNFTEIPEEILEENESLKTEVFFVFLNCHFCYSIDTISLLFSRFKDSVKTM